MPRKFDQDAKDRVVRLVEDRILAENMSMWAGLVLRPGGLNAFLGVVPLVGVLSRRDKP